MRAVRRVVGRDAVDRPVDQACYQRLTIGLGPQRRVHLHPRVERAHLLLGKAEMVWTDLGRDVVAEPLRLTDRLDRLGAAEVLHVHRSAFVTGKRGVAGDHCGLAGTWNPADPENGADCALVHRSSSGERGIFFVEREHAARHLLVLQRLAQHSRRLNRHSVIGEASRPGGAELRHRRQLLTTEANGDRSQEANRDARLAPRGLAQRTQHGSRIDDRVGVRHRQHSAEAPGSR